MSKYTLWGIISLIFIWVGIDSLDEDRTLGIIMIMGASFALAYITYLWKKHEGSTLEQLKLMQEMTSNEIEKLRKRKQEIIDEGAKKGEVISTEKVLESLDELKTSYDGDNPEEYFAKIDKMKQDFRDKYGPTIPVDVAYKISEGLEEW